MSKARELAELSRTVADSADAVAITVDSNENTTFTGVVTANAGVVVDNFTLDGTTLALSSGSITLDSAAQVIIDGDDEGTLTLKNSGTQYGILFNQSNDFKIKSLISDGDIVFLGNDGGVGFTALTLDMSAAGEATFNAGIKLSDGNAASFGAGGDLLVYHSSNENIIQTNTSDQDLLFRGKDGGSTITALTLDMSEAGAATFNAGATFGGPIQLTAGALAGAGNAGLSHRSADNKVYLQAGTGGFNILDDQQNTHVAIDSAGAATFSSNIATTTGNITLGQTTTFPTTGLISHTNNYLYMEGGSGGIILRSASGSSQMMFITAAEVVVNNDSADMDFRVESNDNTHMLFVDGGNNSVNIGSSSNIGGMLNIAGSLKTMNSSAKVMSSLRPSGWGYSQGAYGVTVLGDGTTGGTVSIGYDPSGNPSGAFSGYGQEMLFRSDMSFLQPNAANNGYVPQFRMDSSQGVTLNENGLDLDFRVESDNSTHMLFVDASTDRIGVGVAAPNNTFDVQSSYTNAARIRGSSNLPLYSYHDSSGVGWATGSGTSYSELIYMDPVNDKIVIYTGGGERAAFGASEIVFNNGGANQDFRVESDDNANMLRVDAGENRVITGSSGVHSIGTTNPPLQVGDTLTFQNYGVNTNVTTDTGISINQGNNGMAMQVLASNHSATGTATLAGQYFLKFYYDGNNAPAVTLVAGDNLVTFGVSGSNTLTITMPAGGNSISFITSG